MWVNVCVRVSISVYPFLFPSYRIRRLLCIILCSGKTDCVSSVPPLGVYCVCFSSTTCKFKIRKHFINLWVLVSRLSSEAFAMQLLLLLLCMCMRHYIQTTKRPFSIITVSIIHLFFSEWVCVAMWHGLNAEIFIHWCKWTSNNQVHTLCIAVTKKWVWTGVEMNGVTKSSVGEGFWK